MWCAAGFVVLVHLLLQSTVPSIAQTLVAGSCTVLVLVFGRLRYEFRVSGAQLITAPDAGFVVLLAVATSPELAAASGLLLGVNACRHVRSWNERAFQVATLVLTTAVPAVVVHALFTLPVTGRSVLGAVALAAISRALLGLCAQLLVAQARAQQGAMLVLRNLPVITILALEAGLPTATVATAGPFLDQPVLALAVVVAGQLVTWRLAALQHSHYMDRRTTDELVETFQRFVPQHVATSILTRHQHEPGPVIGGDRRDLSVLFLDIRGFTAWSEQTDPSEVFNELNLLLGELAEAVLTTDGTIDKFTGDGLMAFWNAPSDQADHAARAVRSIPLLLMRVHEFNLRREARGGPPLMIGIGIASGPAMVGNVGHRNRLAFTAIGDTVNRAARLESATRDVDVAALLDEPTFLALPHHVQRQLTRLDSIEVKGRRERVRLYAPTALVHRRRSA